jgi:tRNA ligase
MVSFDLIAEVDKLAKEASESGTFKGKAIEGFVIRCRLKEGGQESTFFFKIKFDEPYLMFREWREVTKYVLKGKIPQFRFQLTDKYITFITKLLRTSPELFKDYLKNRGIILIRNLFLESQGIESFDGINLKEFCQEARNSFIKPEGTGSEKVLIVPVASIGMGKTTLGRSLSILFPSIFGHIQNDNITQKKNKRQAFELLVLQKFAERDFIYADRNNHLYEMREGLYFKFKDAFPGGRIIAIDWGVDFADKQYLIKETIERVRKR